MTGLPPIVRMPVGIVVERRKAKGPWIDFVWRPVAALPAIPDMPPWTTLHSDGESADFYIGAAEVALFRSETGMYRDNLASGAPALWVALRPTGIEPPYNILTVTADPSEGEALTEPGTDLVEPVPMPEAIRANVEAFVAQHHVEQAFFKRKRDRAGPPRRGGGLAKDDES